LTDTHGYKKHYINTCKNTRFHVKFRGCIFQKINVDMENPWPLLGYDPSMVDFSVALKETIREPSENPKIKLLATLG